MTITTVGAGIGSSLAFMPETVYGGVVASPTWIFIEPNSFTPKRNKVTKQSSGLAAGRLVDETLRRVVVERSGGVEVPLDWCQNSRTTSLLNQISASYAPGAAGSQAASGGIYSGGARLTPAAPVYGYAHSYRNKFEGRSTALQMGIPTTDGILRQYDGLGGKMTKIAWSCKAGELLTATTSWDLRYLSDPLIDTTYPAVPPGGADSQTPYTQATPSYAVSTPFDFANAQIQIGSSITTASNSTAIDGLTGFDLSVERKLNVSRQYYGNAGLKDEPVTNDLVAISGTLTSDFVNKTYFADAFYSDTPLFAIVTFGAMTATSPALQFVMSNLFLNDGSPGAPSKEVVSNSFPFVATYDLTNEPLTTIIQSTDATV